MFCVRYFELKALFKLLSLYLLFVLIQKHKGVISPGNSISAAI